MHLVALVRTTREFGVLVVLQVLDGFWSPENCVVLLGLGGGGGGGSGGNLCNLFDGDGLAGHDVVSAAGS